MRKASGLECLGVPADVPVCITPLGSPWSSPNCMSLQDSSCSSWCVQGWVRWGVQGLGAVGGYYREGYTGWVLPSCRIPAYWYCQGPTDGLYTARSPHAWPVPPLASPYGHAGIGLSKCRLRAYRARSKVIYPKVSHISRVST